MTTTPAQNEPDGAMDAPDGEIETYNFVQMAESIRYIREIMETSAEGVGETLEFCWLAAVDYMKKKSALQQSAKPLAKKSMDDYLQKSIDNEFMEALHNRELNRLEFLTEDCTVIYERISPWFEVGRKNGTDEIVGFALWNPLDWAKQLKPSPDAENQVDLESLKRSVIDEMAVTFKDDGAWKQYPVIIRGAIICAIEHMHTRGLIAGTKAGEWLPMSSAPNDGTKVDLWVEFEKGSERVTDCSREGNGEWFFWSKMHGVGNFVVRPKIIAWMPPPTPPQADREAV